MYVSSAVCLVAQLCLTFCDPMDYSPPGSSVHGNSLGKNTGVGCHALLQVHILTIINNAAMNIWMHISFRINVFNFFHYLCVYPGVELLDPMAVLFSVCEETTYYFPQWLYPFTLLPTVYKWSFFSKSLPTFDFCGLFDDSYSDSCERISHLVLTCISLMINDCTPFHVSIGHLCIFFEKMSV